MNASVLIRQFLQRVLGDSPSSTIALAAIDDGGELLNAVATGGYEALSDAEVEKMPAPDEGKLKRPSGTDSPDVKLINAARAANAYVPLRGKQSDRFENATNIFFSQQQAPVTVFKKVRQDRFNILRKQ